MKACYTISYHFNDPSNRISLPTVVLALSMEEAVKKVNMFLKKHKLDDVDINSVTFSHFAPIE